MGVTGGCGGVQDAGRVVLSERAGGWQWAVVPALLSPALEKHPLCTMLDMLCATWAL